MTATPDPTTPPRPYRWHAWFVPALVATAVLDLVSKEYLFRRYAEGETFSWWGELTFNTGVAWGLFGRHPEYVLILTLVLIPVLGWVWWKQFRREGRLANLAFGLILGGALGNGYDRLMMGVIGPEGGFKGVRDFIRIDLNMVGIDYVWPNFNIADAGISVGFALLVVLMAVAPRPTPAAPATGRS